MQNFLDFMSAALPWLAMGFLLAVIFAKNGRKENAKEKKPNCGTEGMCLGMCLGVALGSAFGGNTGLGLSLGMLAGLAIGSCFEKDGEEK